MKYVKGDLLAYANQGFFDVIVHGCNCYNTFGKGLALTIKNSYPEAYKADCRTMKGDRRKLGTYTSCETGTFTIVNAYTQFTYWDVDDMLSYSAVENVFKLIKKDFGDKRIGIPLIGAVLACGDWTKISALIEANDFENLTVVVFNKKDYLKCIPDGNWEELEMLS